MAAESLVMQGVEVGALVAGVARDRLTPVTLYRVRANRSESGSGGWKSFYFLSEKIASDFYWGEAERSGGTDPVSALHDEATNTYYLA